MPDALAELQQACGGDAAAASGADAICGVPVRWVARPGSTHQSAAVMQVAATHGLAVVVRGAGTRLRWGLPPERADLVLDTTRLDAVVEHSAGDLVVVTGAGRRLEDLQRDLAGAGQRLGVDPPRRGTVGGAVAAASTGPLRLHHGAVRDLVIGMTLVRADGVVAHSGGKVVKNVAGYDVGKLLTGSFGTLGVITEVAFRLHPQPAAQLWVTAPVAGVDGIQQAVQAVVHSQLVPSGVELDLDAGQDRGTMAVLVEGHPDGLPDRAREAAALLGDGAEVVDEPVHWWGTEPGGPAPADAGGPGGQGTTLLKVTYEIGSLPALLAALRRVERESGCAASFRGSVAVGTGYLAAAAGDGSVVRLVEGLRIASGAFGGSVVVLEAAAEVKGRVDPWGPVGGLALMRAVKQRFDPGRLLAPGRFVGGI